MSEETEKKAAQDSQPGSASQSSWQEVGQQLKELGDSLAMAFRASWENEHNQRRLQEIRAGLESMVEEVSKTIDETAKSPQGQHLREEAEKTVEKVRSAGEQTVQEVRPQLINALQQLNAELQKMVDHMEKKNTPPSRTDNNPGA